jgi:predicted acyltransferase
MYHVNVAYDVCSRGKTRGMAVLQALSWCYLLANDTAECEQDWFLTLFSRSLTPFVGRVKMNDISATT